MTDAGSWTIGVMMSCGQASYTGAVQSIIGLYGGVRGWDGTGEKVVNLSQERISSLSSGMVIRFDGSGSNIRLRMEFSPGERGRIDLRKLLSRRKARKVESSQLARFHGFRPQVRLTRMTPKDQTSLGADA